MVVFAALDALAAPAGPPAVNEWRSLGEPAFPLPEKGYPNLTGPALVWDAEGDRGLLAPILTEAECRSGPGLRSFAPSEPGWRFVPGKPLPGLLPDMWDSPRACAYLPTLKKILVLRQEWAYSPKKQSVSGWLVDPRDATWEPILDKVSMSAASRDFHPAPCRDGLRLPIWGSLCYDALNQEAVAFGGGGIWGRVGTEREKVLAGDWILLEDSTRIRRLLPNEKPPSAARKWYPGHAGTWTFSETDRVWSPTTQPLGEQPSGRILPGMAYDSDRQCIVLFGGDDLARCLGDTWVYDCKTRKWSRRETKTAPEPRAGHALVYVPGQKTVLLAGGYAGGWRPLKDVWAYDTQANEWTRLDLDLPTLAGHASAVFDAKRGHVVLAAYPATRGNRNVPVFMLSLDRASVKTLAADTTNTHSAFHCKGKTWLSDLPDEWLTGVGAPEDPNDVFARLKALPANSWKNMSPPKRPRERTWGIYLYDPRTHTGFAWGGGHSGYPGAEISEYHLPTNRWRGMLDATNYNPVWLHGMVGGPPGVSFGGWSLLPSHARRSYGIDPVSNSIITYAGDVYSIQHHQFVDHIGNFPIDWGGPSYQVAYVTTPHGLYGFASTYGGKGTGWLCKANVAGGTWDVVSKNGPAGHHENDFLVHDAKRDRILCFRHKGAIVWTFDFKSGSWSEEQAAGARPAAVMGDGAYIPEMDAVLTMFPDVPKGPEKLYFYKCGERRWYTAPSTGDPFQGSNNARDYSPSYDPKLGLVVRITQAGFAQYVNVHVMRLDPKTLKLTPLP
jgi:hypothetical protein